MRNAAPNCCSISSSRILTVSLCVLFLTVLTRAQPLNLGQDVDSGVDEYADYPLDIIDDGTGDLYDGLGKRAWNSNFSGGVGKRGNSNFGLGKRAWNSNFSGGMGKRAWNKSFSGGIGKRAWNSNFSGGMGKRAWTSNFSGGIGKRAWNNNFSGGVGK